jgi:diguanylate cyclase (GGDEF)-like protein
MFFLIAVVAVPAGENAGFLGLSFVPLQLSGLIFSIAAASTAKNRRAARPWWLLSLGFVLLMLSGGAYVASGVTKPEADFATSDQSLLFVGALFQGGFSVCLLIALLLFGIEPMERPVRRRLTLDVVTVLGGGLMATWYFLLGPYISGPQNGTGVAATFGFIAVPIADLATVLGVCTVLLRGSTPVGRRPLFLLLFGSVALFVADAIISVLALHPELVLSEALRPLLPLVPQGLVVAAAVEQCRSMSGARSADHATRPLRPVTWLPYVALVGGFGLLATAAGREGWYPWVGLVAGGILMTASVTARQFIVLTENRSLATTDPLTGLANRIRLRELLDEADDQSRRSGRLTAVMVLDLDDFKPVNDRLGHEAGDALLVAFAGVLTRNLRASDGAARLGGDEFAVVLADILRVEDAVEVVERILREVDRPFDILGHRVRVRASIGLAVSTAESSAGTLVREADLAMYEAKRDPGRSWGLFVPGTPDARQEEARLREELAVAVDEGQLRVHYQPLISLATRRIVGVEALVRWQHPTRGLLSPDQFIPAAEESGIVQEIDSWVLERACRDVRSWQRDRPPGRGLRLNANFSAKRLQRPDLAAEVLQTLAGAGFDPYDLVLEITETASLEVGSALVHLEALRENGIRIALDDFGTGFSTLGHLIEMPVDILKLDRIFVAELGDETASMAVVQAVIQLGQLLHLDIVAEGIETAEQADRLTELGFGSAQGYYFARPLSAEALTRVLDQERVERLAPAAARVPGLPDR